MRLRQWLACLSTCLALALTAPQSHAQVFGTGPWTGLYVGAHGGYGWAQDSDPSLNGWAGGLQVGYNLQLGSALVGIEGDYTWANLSGSGSFSSFPISGSVDSMWSVRGRLGWSIANSVLLYGTAGYGGFGVSLRTVVSGLSLSADADYKGFVAGGGAELLLTRNIMLRLEGLHYMGSGSGTASGSDGDVTVLRAGVSYKF